MAEKMVKMIAITRVGLGDKKVAKPGEEFTIAEGEVERLEKLGAAKRVSVPSATRQTKPKPQSEVSDANGNQGDANGEE